MIVSGFIATAFECPADQRNDVIAPMSTPRPVTPAADEPSHATKACQRRALGVQDNASVLCLMCDDSHARPGRTSHE